VREVSDKILAGWSPKTAISAISSPNQGLQQQFQSPDTRSGLSVTLLCSLWL
jgi:hypothetical protein